MVHDLMPKKWIKKEKGQIGSTVHVGQGCASEKNKEAG